MPEDNNKYSGIYGRGYKDEDGSLYLSGGDNLLLIREVCGDGTYNVVVLDETYGKELGFLFLENISLREWRRFFLNFRKPEEIKRITESFEEYRAIGMWSSC